MKATPTTRAAARPAITLRNIGVSPSLTIANGEQQRVAISTKQTLLGNSPEPRRKRLPGSWEDKTEHAQSRATHSKDAIVLGYKTRQ
ncbi:hypothetical protein GCM10007857_87270 [Bradyrhizobium iriomotense]|uniref:Uncharacterized protein n=1 Tax=Bradyrhizobium iriomotense TaxID=441950 RepID=A0ABQ6BC53_9BRAD|nr:hypothetical protein GCM10007857_87270 [Bradyrhizobium iriomotense]